MFEERTVKTRLWIAILAVVAIAAELHGETVKSLRLALPPQPGPVVEHIGRVLARQVQSRCVRRSSPRAKRRLS